MLKTAPVYDVSVLLNDNQELTCLLLTPPTVETLAEVAKLDPETPTEIVEALAFSRVVNLPAEDEDEALTEIVIAGATLGSIRVVPLTAYLQPAKRGRKPKSAATEAPPEDAEAPPEDAEASPEDAE